MVDLIATTHVLAQSHPILDEDEKDKLKKMADAEEKKQNQQAFLTKLDSQKAECYGRTYMYGLATGTVSFAAVYFLQKHFSRSWKNRKMSLIVATSAFFACFNGYLVASAKLKECDRTFDIMRKDALRKSTDN